MTRSSLDLTPVCAEPLFSVADLCLERPRRKGAALPVLLNLSLEIPTGVTAILGVSGCGKTTLLHTLAGLLEPSSGTILFRGKPLAGPSPERTMVFQSPTLFQWRTVRRNILLGARNRKLLPDECSAYVLELLTTVGLEDFQDAYPKELSQGMARRVEIARAIATGCEVLLLDEPFSALDAHTRLNMYAWLGRLTNELEKSAVIVTHDIDEAALTASKVFVLSPRPASLLRSLSIHSKQPRALEFLTTDEAMRFKMQVLSLLDRKSGIEDDQQKPCLEGRI